MEHVDTKQMSWKDLSKIFPATVYKFRDWSDQYHRRLLSHLEVYFAEPSSFVDSEDCKSYVRYDLLTDEEMLKWVSHVVQKNEPYLQAYQVLSKSIRLMQEPHFRNPEYFRKQQLASLDEFNMRTGILSLTGNPNNNHLWKEYSKDYSGFAVGFNPQILFKHFGGGGPVEYVNELPILKPEPFMTSNVQMSLQVFTKLNKWETEDEYRTFIFRDKKLGSIERKVIVPPEAFTHILIGSKMTEENLNELRDIVNPAIGEIPLIRVTKRSSD